MNHNQESRWEKEKKKKDDRCVAVLFFFLGELYARLRKVDARSTLCDDSADLEDDKCCMWVVNLFLDAETLLKLFFGNWLRIS